MELHTAIFSLNSRKNSCRDFTTCCVYDRESSVAAPHALLGRHMVVNVSPQITVGVESQNLGIQSSLIQGAMPCAREMTSEDSSSLVRV